jgi:hypothetical protein
MEPVREPVHQQAVRFDGYDPLGSGEKVFGESAPARSYLDDQRLTLRTDSYGDTFENRLSDQKMLT